MVGQSDVVRAVRKPSLSKLRPIRRAVTRRLCRVDHSKSPLIWTAVVIARRYNKIRSALQSMWRTAAVALTFRSAGWALAKNADLKVGATFAFWFSFAALGDSADPQGRGP